MTTNPPTNDTTLYGAAAEPKPPRIYTTAERILVVVAVLVAILWDRLIAQQYMDWADWLPYGAAIFWLVYLVIFCVVFRKKMAKNKVLWLVTGFLAAICIWNLIYDYRSTYGELTMLVIPAVIMAHNLFAAGGYRLKQIAAFALNWLCGWFVKPFSAIPVMCGSAFSMVSGERQHNLRRVVLGVLCVLPLMAVLIPLLGSADMVFQYHMEHLLYNFNFASIIGHGIIILCMTALFYSHMWNVGFAAQPTIKESKTVQFDQLISAIVLSSVCALYLLFCTVQFTYLFAGAGLPDGMTYAEYAREGFAQILVICGINLLIFGVFVQYGKQNIGMRVLLLGLLAMTGVMLVSSFVRLNLYIEAYGMTWLRLLSMWFILYLTVVLLLSAVRLFKAQLPLIAVCAFVLLGWYTALGYANPDALIMRANLARESDPTAGVARWIADDDFVFYRYSDDALLELYESQTISPEMLSWLEHKVVRPHLKAQAEPGLSISSWRLTQKRQELFPN